jgi:sulfane dehydrogenase subunit SoxC
MKRNVSPPALAAPLTASNDIQPVAAGGLLNRRWFLSVGAGLAAAGTSALNGLAAPLEVPRHSRVPGRSFRPYGEPSAFAMPALQRGLGQPYGDIAPGAGVAFTPLQALHGTITPASLHFERSHSGVPDIDPAQHQLVIHGLVKRPLVFSHDALLRYPMVSRTLFIECAGNSFFQTLSEAQQLPVGMLNGLLSCSGWTGVMLSTLLGEAGIDPKGRWLIAEGADAASMSRSIPLEKALDDVMVALYQNGEPIRPEQGFPMRLVLPGFEGNMSVKWLRRLKVTEGPAHTKDETSKYTDLLPDGKALQFTYVMGVKSVITRPSPKMTMGAPGFYEISGLAWSGAGRIRKVEVSADGGQSWAAAALQEPVLDRSVVRFRVPWRWDGTPVTLQSRATDEKGRVQEPRSAWSSRYAPGNRYHFNAIQTWRVDAKGEVTNAYV